MNHQNVQIVHDGSSLISTPWSPSLQAICWQRKLNGDFKQIIDALPKRAGITPCELDDLMDLNLDTAGQQARAHLLSDITLLQEAGLDPNLDIIRGYERDDTTHPVPTDVLSFHVDRAPHAIDTYLCTYFGPSSQMLPRRCAQKKVDLPHIREFLWSEYGGKEECGFETFLSETSYDLHFQADSESNIINMGQGSLWKLATENPDGFSNACIHRAPPQNELSEPRLLLIC